MSRPGAAAPPPPPSAVRSQPPSPSSRSCRHRSLPHQSSLVRTRADPSLLLSSMVLVTALLQEPDRALLSSSRSDAVAGSGGEPRRSSLVRTRAVVCSKVGKYHATVPIASSLVACLHEWVLRFEAIVTIISLPMRSTVRWNNNNFRFIRFVWLCPSYHTDAWAFSWPFLSNLHCNWTTEALIN